VWRFIPTREDEDELIMNFYCSLKKKQNNKEWMTLIPTNIYPIDSSSSDWSSNEENANKDSEIRQKKLFKSTLSSILTENSTKEKKLFKFAKTNSAGSSLSNGSLCLSRLNAKELMSIFDSENSRKIKKIESHSALCAPNVLKSLNTQLLDWSENDYIWIGLEGKVYLHNPRTNESDLLWEINSIIQCLSNSRLTHK
jgi:hypothetical protein